jgi:hypothetical protein
MSQPGPEEIKAITILLRAGLPIKEINVLPDDGELVCDAFLAGQKVRAAMGVKGKGKNYCAGQVARYGPDVYCAKHARKMISQAPGRDLTRR